MKEKLKSFFDRKRVLILGFGREGRSTLEILRQCNCTIGIADQNLEITSDINDYAKYTGDSYLSCLDDYDIIMKTPGIALFDNISEEVKKKITSQTDLLLRFCDNEIIGITGTKGKSTTSSLLFHILQKCGKNAILLGNIGIPPLSEIDNLTDDTIIVCEMSCHQLEYVQASPDVAVLLNIYEEHLDHYTDFYAYKHAKENIYRYLTEDSTLIYSARCNNSEIEQLPCDKISASETDAYDIYVDDDKIHICGIDIAVDDLHTQLAGKHNLYNIAIALACAVEEECDLTQAISTIASFHGLEHRLELVRSVKDVQYINDSISTIPLASIAAIKAFDADTIILGGMDRGISYELLVNYLKSPESPVMSVIALPDSGYRIADMLGDNNDNEDEDLDEEQKPQVYRVKDLAEAVNLSTRIADHCCVLSPAAASYGFYKNFEERGNHFKELVNKL